MTEKLENLFNLPDSEEPNKSIETEAKELITAANDISKEIATTQQEDKTDNELDKLADRAVESYEQLIDLGMNVESRFSAPIFDAASKMLGHAITAKLGKAQKKLKEAELKLRAIKANNSDTPSDPNNNTNIKATVYDRNDLINIIRNK